MFMPYQLIKDHITRQDPTALEGKSIIEFGFGDIAPIYELYRESSFLHYYGYDKNNAERIPCTSSLTNDLVFSGPKEPYNIYTQFSQNTENSNILSPSDFYDIFKIKTEHSIQEFLGNPTMGMKFDIAIFSNVFHKIQDRVIPHDILDWYYSNSNPKASLLIKIMISDTFANEEIDWIYSQDEIDDLLRHFPGRIIAEIRNPDFISLLIEKNG